MKIRMTRYYIFSDVITIFDYNNFFTVSVSYLNDILSSGESHREASTKMMN